MVYPYILELPAYGQLHCEEIQVRRHENGQVALIAVTDEQEHLVITGQLRDWKLRENHIFVPDFGEQEGMPKALTMAGIAVAEETVTLIKGRGYVMQVVDAALIAKIAKLSTT